jgi:hypothetical protein
MNATQQDALRDQFAIALAQGYEIWRWTRGRDADGLPAPTASESIARDIWKQADILVATRPTDPNNAPPCQQCGWRTFLIGGGRQQVCLRCDKVYPYPGR